MAKTLVSSGATLQSLRIVTAPAGDVQALKAQVLVDYGTGGTASETVDLFASLTATQKTQLQAMVNKVITAIGTMYQ